MIRSSLALGAWLALGPSATSPTVDPGASPAATVDAAVETTDASAYASDAGASPAKDPAASTDPPAAPIVVPPMPRTPTFPGRQPARGETLALPASPYHTRLEGREAEDDQKIWRPPKPGYSVAGLGLVGTGRGRHPPGTGQLVGPGFIWNTSSKKRSPSHPRLVPRVHIGPIIATGDLDLGLLRRLLNAKGRAIQACYAHGRQRNPGLMGTLVLEVVLHSNENRPTAAVTTSMLPDPGVTACVLDVLERARFPPTAERAHIRFALSLSLVPFDD